jgi:3'(2'), 5'-bisphosphate nucleotidase
MYKRRFESGEFGFDINELLSIAYKAGREIMDVYKEDFDVEQKDDDSPLTLADRRAHNVIQKGLESYGLPILSEEGAAIPYEERKRWSRFWMVDPLDGTKEFIKKNGEFTVNIALIEDGEPVFGVVYAPAKNELYFTDSERAYKASFGESEALEGLVPLPLSRERDEFVVVASKSHLNDETKAFIETLKSDKPKKFLSRGSSLKLCIVAEGAADVYPRLAPTMEWDTAAADAVVRKVGGKVVDFELGNPLKYNKQNLLNPHFIVTP